MKTKLVTFTAMCLVAIAAVAQEKAIKVSYNYNYFSIRGYEIKRPMILITDNEISKFYNPMTNWIDSVNSTPEGRAEYEASRPKIMTFEESISLPTRWEKMYIVKNRKEACLTNYDTVGDERYFSRETFEEIEWVIGDSVMNILGFECIEAKADFRGRHWKVWFSPDVPIQEGPWKLCGLPGLILSARESVGQYSFEATGIELYDDTVPPVYQQELYNEMDRIKLLKFKRLFNENLGIIITAQMSVKNLRPSQFKSLELKADLDFLETDYH